MLLNGRALSSISRHLIANLESQLLRGEERASHYQDEEEGQLSLIASLEENGQCLTTQLLEPKTLKTLQSCKEDLSTYHSAHWSKRNARRDFRKWPKSTIKITIERRLTSKFSRQLEISSIT